MSQPLHAADPQLQAELAAHMRAWSRRSFLKNTFKVAALGVVALSGLLALRTRSNKDALQKPAAITAMSDSEYQLFLAVAAACLPADDNEQELLSWTQLPILENIDHLLAGIPAHARADVTTAFQLFDHGAIVSGWHGKRFVDLDVAAARTYLDEWNHGGDIQRAISNLVRKLAYIAYWREEKTWPAIDYDGPVMAKWGLERYGNAPLPAAAAVDATVNATAGAI